jgi:YD repeat-containing protein
MKITSSIIYFFLIVALFSACSKKKSTLPSGNCNLNMIHDTLGQTNIVQINILGLSYNSSNQINTISSNLGGILTVQNFKYIGNTTTISTDVLNNSTVVDSITYNSAGQVTYISHPEGSDTTHLRFTYDGNGQLINSTNQHQPNDVILTTTYQYINGDISETINDRPNSPDTLYYTYYTDKPFSAMGDYSAWTQFSVYNVIFTKTAHLVKSIAFYDNGLGYIVNVNYTFDSQGRVIGFSAVSGPGLAGFTENVGFVYPCSQ